MVQLASLVAMTTIGWGILGCGDVTEVKSGPAFQKTAGSRLVAVMRRDGERAADYARRHGVSRWYSDAHALIADPEVDAVYIATPPGAHCELALAVCAAGKPCYVEKPMARNHAECERMVSAFRTAGLPLFVAYYRRALPRFVKARDLVRDGALGRITSVSVRCLEPRHRTTDPHHLPWRQEAAVSGGGIFLDLGSHALDYLDHVFGPLLEARGTAANLAGIGRVEDVVGLSFRTADGAIGSGLWNFASDYREDRIEFVGTSGRITFSCFGTDPVCLERDGKAELFACPQPEHVQQPLIRAMVDALRGNGESPSTGESGARTQRVMDVALETYYGGRQRPFWEDANGWPGAPRD